jgi:uncharacterized Zn finger protein
VSSGTWSAQFIEMLESLGMGPQFARGRRYARAGHVRQLTISASLVVALVAGGGDEAYRARIAVRAFSGADWARVERDLAGQAYYTAKLLAGRLPSEIENVFARYGLRLFPDRIEDVAMDCTCPDWEVPCRHLAAACYVLAGSFDRDPFGILAWRGRGRDELLDRLRALRAVPGSEATPAPAADHGDGPPLDQLVDTFWTGGVVDPAAAASPDAGRQPDALLDQLDPVVLPLGRYELADLLRPAYQAIVRTTADDQ